MDFVNKLSGSGSKDESTTSKDTSKDESSSGGMLGGITDKFNNAAGGGKSGEQNEDALDKGIDYVQERMGGGPQDNESAIEQAKDKKIAGFVRDQYKSTTGSEFPIKEKESE